MNALVNIAGKQINVRTSDTIRVPRLNSPIGSLITFDQVLLTQIQGVTNIGSPIVSNAKVKTEILDHVKGDKVIVFKKKRRKGYKVKNGHRQPYTILLIKKIITTQSHGS